MVATTLALMCFIVALTQNCQKPPIGPIKREQQQICDYSKALWDIATKFLPFKELIGT